MDSTAAICQTKRLGFGSKLRHVEIGQFLLQQMVRTKIARVSKICGTLNPANSLTKHLSAQQLEQAVAWLGMIDLGKPEYVEYASATALTISGVKDTAAPAAAARTTRDTSRKTPWKPNYPVTVSALQVIAAMTLLIPSTGSPLTTTGVRDLTTYGSQYLTSYFWQNAMFVCLLVYLVSRIISDLVWVFRKGKRLCCGGRTTVAPAAATRPSAASTTSLTVTTPLSAVCDNKIVMTTSGLKSGVYHLQKYSGTCGKLRCSRESEWSHFRLCIECETKAKKKND
jgi:hypothetical protein